MSSPRGGGVVPADIEPALTHLRTVSRSKSMGERVSRRTKSSPNSGPASVPSASPTDPVRCSHSTVCRPVSRQLTHTFAVLVDKVHIAQIGKPELKRAPAVRVAKEKMDASEAKLFQQQGLTKHRD